MSQIATYSLPNISLYNEYGAIWDAAYGGGMKRWREGQLVLVISWMEGSGEEGEEDSDFFLKG